MATSVLLTQVWWIIILMRWIVCTSAQHDIISSLGQLLSPNARIYFPGSTHFNNLTGTTNVKRPNFSAVVEVATQKDVEHTIQYSIAQGRPFLAVAGGHGETWTLGKVRNGIGISMRGMAFVNISEDGTSAVIGGGTESGEVIPALWAAGKQTTTTACDCAGIVAPMLGGGHGWLQGRYGLLADNIISVQLVLANGSAISVSETEHADLFWAVRGAGHNFGIVTSVEYRIYDVLPGEEQWSYEEYIFTQDKLEPVFEIANTMLRSDHQTQPVELTHYAHFEFQPTIDPEPIIRFWVIWQGSAIPPEYTGPLRALRPASTTTGTTNITGLNAVAGAVYGDPGCAISASRGSVLFGVALRRWSVPALRAAMDIYTALPPALREGSMVLLEAYAADRVADVPAASTAYATRRDPLLVGPAISYARNAGLDGVAAAYGARIRGALVAGGGGPLRSYVNYAHGDESLGALYGYEAWRLRRLQELKAAFDPTNQFRYYGPIVTGSRHDNWNVYEAGDLE